MKIIKTVAAMQRTAARLRAQGRRIGFVPTMGYLHAGHAALLRLARRHADVVVASIFVNPLQFGPREDLSRYPRDFRRDERICRAAGADFIFYPAVADMYPAGRSVFVDDQQLTRHLCGATRPGHFQGVLTVVAKLFNIVQPHVAVFGRKDAQQLRVIQQMVRDLNFPIRIVPGATVREPDGLALSSRNRYLTAEQRPSALCLRRALDLARDLVAQGETAAAVIKRRMARIITRTPHARADYIEIVDWNTLQPVNKVTPPTLVALAVFVGPTRLIDNLLIPA